MRDGKGIACVEHDGKTGNPCVFSKKYYEELMKLSGDVGGKRVVVAHREDVAVMKVEDGREMVDVDFFGRTPVRYRLVCAGASSGAGF